MTRILPSVRLTLATAVVAAVGAVSFVGASGTFDPGRAAADGGTALPAGWELCILQGISAPVTSANVADLDEWQVEEGGSTNNSAAYNPFNTRRTTDPNNAPIPMTMTSNGFPAFTNWLGGCSATVATLFQPNMWSIDAALRAGNVAPPGAFLAAVDQSQWCAPSAGGMPCYVNSILGAAGATMATAVLSGSSALDVYGNVQNDVRAYQLSVLTVSSDQNTLNARNQDLSTALAGAQSTHATLDAATQALRRFAIDEYVSTGLYVSTSFTSGRAAPTGFGPPDADGVVAHQYESIAAWDLVNRDQAAIAAYRAAKLQVKDTSHAVAVAFAALAADSNTQTRSLAKLVFDVATMQTAGACTAITLTSAPLPPVPGAGSSSGTNTTTTTSTTTTTTTTPSTPTTSTTTSTTLPGGNGPAVVPTPPTVPSTTTTTTTTTTLPPTTTTTTTLPPTTTTTTTTPPTPAQPGAAPPALTPPVSADPAAFGALQGCMAALAPPAPAPAT